MAPRAGLRHTAAMDEEKPTRRPDEPKAAHLPAHGRPCLLPEETEGSPDLMAAGGEKVSAWVLRVCGWPTWGRAPRVGRLELLSSTTPPTEAPMTKDQIELIASALLAQQAAVAHLANIVAQACELDREQMASSFESIVQKLPPDTPKLRQFEQTIGYIAQAIRASDASGEWDALMHRLQP